MDWGLLILAMMVAGVVWVRVAQIRKEGPAGTGAD